MNSFNKKYENLLSLSELKKQIDNHHQILNPCDITTSINYYINKLILNGIKVTEINKNIIVLSVYLLMCKYNIDDFNVEMNSLKCGIPLDDYIKYEKLILTKLDWELEIPEKNRNMNNSTIIL